MYSNLGHKEYIQLVVAIVVGFVLVIQSFSILTVIAQTSQNNLTSDNPFPKLHEIKMAAVELPDGHTAYKMLEYKIIDKQNQTKDITSRYSDLPTIPGPTLIMTEGDKAKLTLVNDIGRGAVSLHTHGVHYTITSDGSLKMSNRVSDQGATPNDSYTYIWTAAEGTRGSWPWHDHTFGKGSSGMNMNGVETNGLFSTVIVNPANGKVDALVNGIQKEVNVEDIKKDFVLFVTDDAFWGVEIDNSNNNKHTPLWVNPTLVASKNDLVRFHIQSVGTDFHHFVIDGFEWLKPGTHETTNFENIGPLENHVFTISANNSASYYDEMPIHLLSGMKGKFQVIADANAATSTSSIPGPSPQMQGSGGDSKDTGNSTGVPATSPIMYGTSDNNGEISLVGSD
ncbi:MAG TPA: multicopper oxidase domain-containing protein [Nitrososphaeraceae archaeon]